MIKNILKVENLGMLSIDKNNDPPTEDAIYISIIEDILKRRKGMMSKNGIQMLLCYMMNIRKRQRNLVGDFFLAVYQIQ